LIPSILDWRKVLPGCVKEVMGASDDPVSLHHFRESSHCRDRLLQMPRRRFKEKVAAPIAGTVAHLFGQTARLEVELRQSDETMHRGRLLCVSAACDAPS
jgi:ATP-dependent protease HslVU (ClpYQ) peptidase subunit